LNTETLWRLPDIFAAYSPKETSPAVIDHPPFEDNGYITFGCFNNFTKVTDPVLQTWAKIMEAVPDSRLIIEIAGIQSKKIRGDVERRMIKHGLPLDRVILEPRKPENQYVLYSKIDIALDPFPAVGGTTSMDTLWMGVPFITLAGEHFGSRMGVSILSNVDLKELIAENTDQYIDIATIVAKDKNKLKQMRHNLRDRFAASPAMDKERFARNMDAAYRQMWKKWVEAQD
jgi:protein O-GlcNAc transferase